MGHTDRWMGFRLQIFGLEREMTLIQKSTIIKNRHLCYSLAGGRLKAAAALLCCGNEAPSCAMAHPEGRTSASGLQVGSPVFLVVGGG